MERSLSQRVYVVEKQQQEDQPQEPPQAETQQQPIVENEKFGARIHQDENKDDEKEEDDDVDEPARKKRKPIPRKERQILKRSLQGATASAAGSADTTADPSAMTAAAAAGKTPEKLVQVAIDFLEKMAIEFPNCIKVKGPPLPKSCSCFSIFRRTDSAESPNKVTLNTARYMVYFQQLQLRDHYPLLIKWILDARRRVQLLKERQREGPRDRMQHIMYALPSFDNDGGTGTTTVDTDDVAYINYYINNNRNGPPFFVCQSALLRILDKGHKFWATCRNAADAGDGATPVRKSVSYPANRQSKFIKSGADDDVKSFLENLVEFATGTGETLVSPHDGETYEILELDADLTKRQLYKEYAFERGWIVTMDSDRTWTTKEREADQDDWNPQDKKVIMTPATFNHYWRKFFPYLRVSHGHHGNWHNNQEPATFIRRTRPCQGLSGVNYTHVIQASVVEAVIAAVQANGIAPRTFPLAPSLEERFGNYGMVGVRTEKENNCNEEQGMSTADNYNDNNKEHYVIRSKSCDGVGNVRGLCKSCNQVSHSIANLSMRLALQSSTPSSKRQQKQLAESSDVHASDSTATC